MGFSRYREAIIANMRVGGVSISRIIHGEIFQNLFIYAPFASFSSNLASYLCCRKFPKPDGGT
jgi:hypothetical protein